MLRVNENGRSMIEMLGVLAIVGVLSVGGMSGYSKAMMTYRSNKQLNQLVSVITGIINNKDKLPHTRTENLVTYLDDLDIIPIFIIMVQGIVVRFRGV